MNSSSSKLSRRYAISAVALLVPAVELRQVDFDTREDMLDQAEVSTSLPGNHFSRMTSLEGGSLLQYVLRCEKRPHLAKRALDSWTYREGTML